MRELMRLGAAGVAFGVMGSGLVVDTMADPIPAMVTGSAEVPYLNTHERPELPGNIGKVITSSVEVVAPFGMAKDGKIEDSTRNVGSGTQVEYKGSEVVVTAAHVVAAMGRYCAEGVINYRSDDAKSDSLQRRFAQQTIVSTQTSEESSVYNRGEDAAVVVPTGSGNPAVSALKVQKIVRLSPGDDVFSLGYGGRPGYVPQPGKNNPEIVAGKVLDLKGGMVEVVESIAGYGPAGDDETKPGDSGGTVVDSQGRFIGNMVNVSDHRGYELEIRAGVRVPDKLRQYTVATIQLVDQQRLASMVDRTQDCQRQPKEQ